MINKIVLVKIRKTTWPVTVNRSNMILKFNIDSSRPDGLSIIVRLILQKGKSSLKFFKFFIPFCHIFAFCQGHIYFQYKQHESEKKKIIVSWSNLLKLIIILSYLLENNIGFKTKFWFHKLESGHLNPIQETSTSFCLVTSTNVETRPQNFLTSSFNTFATLV